jgi:hypothetical protein
MEDRTSNFGLDTVTLLVALSTRTERCVLQELLLDLNLNQVPASTKTLQFAAASPVKI